MKLNPDCIRDILLTVEAESGYNKGFYFHPNTPESKKWEDFDYLKKYQYEEVCYHLRQCDDTGYFSCRGHKKALTFWLGNGFVVDDLSPKGHEFLNNIREDTNWKKTKEKAKSIGSLALSVLEKIATSVISTQINSALGKEV
jgi:hypothetical protein